MPNIATRLKKLTISRCVILHLLDGLLSQPMKLEFENCPEMQSWCEMHNINYVEGLHGLKGLTIWNSMTIQEMLQEIEHIEDILSLQNLCLNNCIVRYSLSVYWLPSQLQCLQLCSCALLQSLTFNENRLSLKKLYISSCPRLTFVNGLLSLTSLQFLVIQNCPWLQLTTYDWVPATLRSLVVQSCANIRSLQLNQIRPALEELQILDCCMITSLVGLSNNTSLQTLTIRECPELWFSLDENFPLPLNVHIAHSRKLRQWCERHYILYGQRLYYDPVDSNMGQFLCLAPPSDCTSVPPSNYTDQELPVASEPTKMTLPGESVDQMIKSYSSQFLDIMKLIGNQNPNEGSNESVAHENPNDHHPANAILRAIGFTHEHVNQSVNYRPKARVDPGDKGKTIIIDDSSSDSDE